MIPFIIIIIIINVTIHPWPNMFMLFFKSRELQAPSYTSTLPMNSTVTQMIDANFDYLWLQIGERVQQM